jgi:hypothetical protein
MAIRRPARAKPDFHGKPLPPKPRIKHPDRRSIRSRGRRSTAPSVWDRVASGEGPEGRAAAAATRLKSLEHGGGFWSSPSCPSQWGKPHG